jgi:hypothetical protein
MRTARCYHGGGACTIAKMEEWALAAARAARVLARDVALVARALALIAGGAAALIAGGACGCSPAPTGAATVAPLACHAGPYTVWLAFDGTDVAHAAADDATATPPQSLLAQSATTVPPFDAALAAPRVTRQQAIDAVVDRVRTVLAPYDIAITTARPTSGRYALVAVGGTSATLSLPGGEAGLANEDCGNAVDTDVAYDFAGELTPRFGGVVAVANAAAHELGHAFGLMHTDNPHDLMYSVAAPTQQLPDLFTLRFGAGNYSSYSAGQPLPVPQPCAGSATVDNGALLACNAGAAPPGGDTTPPTLSWDAPSGTTVTTPFAASFSASDNVGVMRVEVYQNLELVAVLTAPPYATTLTATPGSQVYVTAEAIDPSANRATVTRLLTIAQQPPDAPCSSDGECASGRCTPGDGGAGDGGAGDGGAGDGGAGGGAGPSGTCARPCGATSPCPQGFSCVANFCAAAGAGAPDMGDAPRPHGGCSVAPARAAAPSSPASSALLLVMLSWLATRARIHRQRIMRLRQNDSFTVENVR